MKTLIVGLMAFLLTGCLGELWAVRTVDDIQKSEYRADIASTKDAGVVAKCMLQTLYDCKTAEGKRSYADVTSREIGTAYELMQKSPQRPAAGIYDAGGEILLLIDVRPEATGSLARIWVHQYMLSPSPKENLATVQVVVRACV